MINLLPFRRTALLLEGDDLRVVTVRSTLTGATSRTLGVIAGFRAAPVESLRAEARSIVAEAGGELVLVLPASLCASRPVPITAKNWAASVEARDELVEAYFPFGAREALTGLLEFTPEGGQSPQGAMFVAPRAPVDELRERVASVFGAPVHETLPSTLCLPALGLQHVEHATVLERDAGDLATALAWGRPLSVAEPYDDTGRGELYVVGRVDDETPRGKRVTGDQLAVAACLLPFVPGVRYRALGGQGRPKLDRRLPLAAAITLLVLAGVLASSALTRARYRAGIERMDREMASIREEVQGVQQLRERTSRLATSLERIDQTTSAWASVLPELREALAVTPGEGFVHRVELTPTRVTVSGESAKALAVLESLENTDAFEGARQSGAVTRTPRELETFSVQARRVSNQKGGTP